MVSTVGHCSIYHSLLESCFKHLLSHICTLRGIRTHHLSVTIQWTYRVIFLWRFQLPCSEPCTTCLEDSRGAWNQRFGSANEKDWSVEDKGLIHCALFLKETNNRIGPTVKHVWNVAMHLLHIWGGFVINTTAYHSGRYNLHLLILKSSMTNPWGPRTCLVGTVSAIELAMECFSRKKFAMILVQSVSWTVNE